MCRSLRLHAACVLLLCAGALRADDKLSPLATALAGAGGAAVHGIDAIGVNPALLGTGYEWEFTAYPFGAYALPVFGIGTPSQHAFELNDLDELLARLSVTLPPDADKQRIVNGLNLSGVTISWEQQIAAAAHPLGGGYTLAIHANQRGLGTYALDPRVDSVLHSVARSGNMFPIYLRDPASAEAMWFNEYGVSLAYERRSGATLLFAVGGTVKYLQGLGYAHVNASLLNTINLQTILGSTLQVSVDYDIQTSQRTYFDASNLPFGAFYTPFPPAAGSGAGVDLGIAKDLTIEGRRVRAALSVTDLGAISWSDPGVRSVHRVDSIPFGGAFYPVDSLRVYAGTVRPLASLVTTLPARLHLALAMHDSTASGWEPGMLTLQFTQGLVAGNGNSLSPRIAVGAEWPHGGWYAAAGLAYNSDESGSIALGAGLRLFNHIWLEGSMGRVNGLFESPLLVNAVARIKGVF